MIRYQVLPESQLIVVRSSGTTTVEECRRFLAHAARHLNHSDTFNVLNDVRNLTSYLSFAETEAVFRSMLDMGLGRADRRNAILVGDLAQYGISRMFEQQSHEALRLSTSVVRTVEDAAQWLERPVDVLQAALDSPQWLEPD